MPHRISSEIATSTAAVAIDKDKNSSSAVKWAIDHLSKSCPMLTLIHVIRTPNSKCSPNRSNGLATESNSGSSFIDPQSIFKPSRLYCARKGIVAHEVLLEDVDVSKALLDYINKNHIHNIVLGAPAKNPLARKTLNFDVPSIINKAAPDFCSVYVIAKDKPLSVRPAAKSTPAFLTPPVQHFPHILPSSMANEHETHDGFRNREKVGTAQNGLPSDKMRFGKGHKSRKSFGDLDISFLCVNKPVGCNDFFQMPKRSTSADDTTHILENRNPTEAIDTEHNALSSIELEAKMKRLQLELKQTMDMYNTACKGALPEKQKINELISKLPLEEAQNDARYRKYTLEEIETATNKFSGSSKIGEGGYGPVFKGKLDHTPVAIKVLRSDGSQGRQQFQQEIEVLSSIRHPNMVLLLGACPEYGCLVYEFMDNGSLEDRLFRKGNTPPIPWQIRFQIASDIAIGLLFLHQAKPEPLVHRDLKPANILLDHNYVCKISDVGLARLVPPSVSDNVTQYHMTSAAGTFCYIDPEYQQTGKLGTKSDVYSLGVMLLQIITARPPMGLAHHVERTIEKGTFEDILDPTVPDWPVEEALAFAKLALKCAELRKKDRPDLGSDIVPELSRLKEVGMNSILNNRSNYHR